MRTVLLLLMLALMASSARAADNFAVHVEPVFKQHCYRCHSHAAGVMKGGLTLDSRSGWAQGGDSGPAVVPGKPSESMLLKAVKHLPGVKAMPPQKTISAAEVAAIETWILQGAPDPRTATSASKSDDWWSLRPLVPPTVPAGGGHPIDAFIRARLAKAKLAPSAPADRATLIRRLHQDLVGLPPTRAEVEAFVSSTDPKAYEAIVDRLLASPRHAERWARHWLDAIHFAETHGCEHDMPRDHAWRFRDYVIGSLHADKPWGRFIREQLAADHLYPDQPGLTSALGFLGAGLFDHSAFNTARNTFDYLDRDDMVNQTMSAFTSTTANCARCHAHKFDPISQEDYYALQAVFAGVVEGNIAFDEDPTVAARRKRWTTLATEAQNRNKTVLLDPVHEAMVREQTARRKPSASWRTMVAETCATADETAVEQLADGSLLMRDLAPEKDTYVIGASLPAGQMTALRLEVLPDDSLPFRGPGRCANGNLHLSEVEVSLLEPGAASPSKLVISKATADFDQAGWDITRAIDGKPEPAWGIYPEVGKPHAAVFEFAKPVELKSGTRITVALRQLHGGGHLIGRLRLSTTSGDPRLAIAIPESVEKALATPAGKRTEMQRLDVAAHVLSQLAREELSRLPPLVQVYGAGVKSEVILAVNAGPPQQLTEPKKVFVLRRGDIDKPGAEAIPGALSAVPGLKSRFEISPGAGEGARRAALANWISSHGNPLTWRSIANRVWQHHFGRGLCDTPSDFGRMGGVPSHPELLDWLASSLRDNGESLKHLHRLIVTSETYKQSSAHRADALAMDGDNHLLCRQNRRRLDADAFRDAVLNSSDSLDLSMGGPGVREFKVGAYIQVTPALDYAAYDWALLPRHRRSIYRFVWRGIPDPFMEVLDFPDLGLLSPVRGNSSSPLQALAMYNDRFVLHFSEMLGRTISMKAPEPDAAAREAYSRVFSRVPTHEEAKMAAELIKKHGAAALCRVLFNTNEFLFVE